jgi:hypothetical protein
MKSDFLILLKICKKIAQALKACAPSEYFKGGQFLFTFYLINISPLLQQN